MCEGGRLVTKIKKVGHLPSDTGQTGAVFDVNGISPSITRAHGNAIIKIVDVPNTKRKESVTTKTYETKPFRYVSLFSGIGGFETALNRLGGRCELASEVDEFAKRAYTALYGGEKLHGDVTKLDAKDVPDHDLLVAGFPCQSFSVAGKRGGFDDARGTLFFEVVRILAEKKPRLVLLENVKGLVSHDKGRTLNTIVTALNECGYTVDFEVLNSKYFGVPQNRERIFIVGVLDGQCDEWIEVSDSTRKDVVARGKRRIAKLDGVRTFNFDWPKQTEVTTRLRDVLEDGVDERFYLSEEKTAKLVAQLRADNEPIDGDQVRPTLTPDRPNKRQNGRRFKDNDDPSFTLASQDRHGGLDARKPIDGVEYVGTLNGEDKYKMVYGVLNPEGQSQCLTTNGGGNREPKITEIANGNNLSYCIDANYTKGISPGSIGKGRRTHVYEIEKLGNLPSDSGQTSAVYGTDGISPTHLSCHGNAVTKVYDEPRYRIRKLTPRETWRLQGFTDAQHDAVADAGISNSQRYKMAGNAVTVNVIEAIGERLLPYIHARPSSSGASNSAKLNA